MSDRKVTLYTVESQTVVVRDPHSRHLTIDMVSRHRGPNGEFLAPIDYDFDRAQLQIHEVWRDGAPYAWIALHPELKDILEAPMRQQLAVGEINAQSVKEMSARLGELHNELAAAEKRIYTFNALPWWKRMFKGGCVMNWKPLWTVPLCVGVFFWMVWVILSPFMLAFSKLSSFDVALVLGFDLMSVTVWAFVLFNNKTVRGFFGMPPTKPHVTLETWINANPNLLVEECPFESGDLTVLRVGPGTYQELGRGKTFGAALASAMRNDTK